MEPIPETSEAIDEYGPLMPGGEDTLTQLKAIAERVRRVVPECVGMSLALLDHGVTLTLVASEGEIAALDGVQYLAGGPCVSAVEDNRVVEYRATDVLTRPPGGSSPRSLRRLGSPAPSPCPSSRVRRLWAP
jgi:hypothetical protein